jgi:hypothetical protein
MSVRGRRWQTKRRRGGKQRCVNGHDGALVNKEGIDGADKESKSDQQGTMWCPEVVEIMRTVMQDDGKGWWTIPLCEKEKRMDEWRVWMSERMIKHKVDDLIDRNIRRG